MKTVQLLAILLLGAMVMVNGSKLGPSNVSVQSRKLLQDDGGVTSTSTDIRSGTETVTTGNGATTTQSAGDPSTSYDSYGNGRWGTETVTGANGATTTLDCDTSNGERSCTGK